MLGHVDSRENKLESALRRPPGGHSTLRENPAWPIPVPRHQSLRLRVTYSQNATRSMAAVGNARMAWAISRMPLSRSIVVTSSLDVSMAASPR